MVRTDTLVNALTDIADSIRSKTKESAPIPVAEYDKEIGKLWGKNDLMPLDTTQLVPATLSQVKTSVALDVTKYDTMWAAAEDGIDDKVHVINRIAAFANIISVYDKNPFKINKQITVSPGTTGLTNFHNIAISEFFMDTNNYYLLSTNYAYKVRRSDNTIIGVYTIPAGAQGLRRWRYTADYIWRLEGTTTTNAVLRWIKLSDWTSGDIPITATSTASGLTDPNFGIAFDFEINTAGDKFIVITTTRILSLTLNTYAAGGIAHVANWVPTAIPGGWAGYGVTAGTQNNNIFCKILPNGGVWFGKNYYYNFGQWYFPSLALSGTPTTRIDTDYSQYHWNYAGFVYASSTQLIFKRSGNAYTFINHTGNGINYPNNGPYLNTDTRPLFGKDNYIYIPTNYNTPSPVMWIYRFNPGFNHTANIMTEIYDLEKFPTRTDKLLMYRDGLGARVYDIAGDTFSALQPDIKDICGITDDNIYVYRKDAAQDSWIDVYDINLALIKSVNCGKFLLWDQQDFGDYVWFWEDQGWNQWVTVDDTDPRWVDANGDGSPHEVEEWVENWQWTTNWNWIENWQDVIQYTIPYDRCYVVKENNVFAVYAMYKEEWNSNQYSFNRVVTPHADLQDIQTQFASQKWYYYDIWYDGQHRINHWDHYEMPMGKIMVYANGFTYFMGMYGWGWDICLWYINGNYLNYYTFGGSYDWNPDSNNQYFNANNYFNNFSMPRFYPYLDKAKNKLYLSLDGNESNSGNGAIGQIQMDVAGWPWTSQFTMDIGFQKGPIVDVKDGLVVYRDNVIASPNLWNKYYDGPTYNGRLLDKETLVNYDINAAKIIFRKLIQPFNKVVKLNIGA